MNTSMRVIKSFVNGKTAGISCQSVPRSVTTLTTATVTLNAFSAPISACLTALKEGRDDGLYQARGEGQVYHYTSHIIISFVHGPTAEAPFGYGHLY
jgi:hypothetical protein